MDTFLQVADRRWKAIAGLPDIAGMLNRLLVFRYQILIDCLANGCDSYFVHIHRVRNCSSASSISSFGIRNPASRAISIGRV